MPTGIAHRTTTLAFATIVLVALADLFFYDHVVGWTVAGFQLAVSLSLMLRVKRPKAQSSAAVLAALLIGNAIALSLEPGPLGILLGMAGILALALTARLGWSDEVGVWYERVCSFVANGIARVLLDAAILRKTCKRHPGARRGRLASAVKPWLLPALFGAIFLGLFSLANPVISSLIDQLTYWVRHPLELFFEAIRLPRILFWLVIGAALWTLGRAKVTTLRRFGPAHREENVTDGYSAEAVVRCLKVFNAVFALQTCLDVFYLTGGRALPEGMTYAEYAHRGAYPLVATALLAGVFVVATFRPGGVAERSPSGRRLVFAWIAQNVFLMCTAVWRLHMYVESYGLTRWRIAAVIWMGLVALGFVWIFRRIAQGRSNSWLLKVNSATLIAVLYCGSFVNFDARIAWYNVKHSREVTAGSGVVLDLAYLEHLGVESILPLRWLSRCASPLSMRNAAQTMQSALTEKLNADLQDWRGWTLVRAEIVEQLLRPDPTTASCGQAYH